MSLPCSSAAVFLASLGVFMVLVLFVPVEAGADPHGGSHGGPHGHHGHHGIEVAVPGPTVG